MPNSSHNIKSTDIASAVMAHITANHITMKPRWYFVAGSILMAASLVGVSIGAIFLVNLLFFLLRQHGPMGSWRLQQMLTTFPWWIPVLALIGIIVSLVLLKRYDFSYKHHFGLIVLGFIAAVILAGFIIDNLGLNTYWSHQGPMRRLYQHFDSTTPPGNFHPGRGRSR